MITLIPEALVPEEFRPHQKKPYPLDNEKPFEEWFYDNYDPMKNLSDRVYLPVFWTSYYCNNRYGRDIKAMNRLQLFLSQLDRKKKYFTIVQYDDGIINKLTGLDIKIFGMGCKGDVQLPLVCQPHKYEFKETGRPIFASFVGAETHPIRTEMIKELQGKDGYFISTEQTSLHSYCYILSQSKFVLCPRGYGKTSFRIMEALQYGAIPVYISDEYLYSEGTVGREHMDELGKYHSKRYVDESKEAFNRFYTYESVAKRIYENV